MKQNQNYLTLKDVDVFNPALEIDTRIPANSIVTCLSESETSMTVCWNNREYFIFRGPKTECCLRRLPYPISKPKTISEYKNLVKDVISDMADVFGSDISIEADKSQVIFKFK